MRLQPYTQILQSFRARSTYFVDSVKCSPVQAKSLSASFGIARTTSPHFPACWTAYNRALQLQPHAKKISRLSFHRMRRSWTHAKSDCHIVRIHMQDKHSPEIFRRTHAPPLLSGAIFSLSRQASTLVM